MYRYDDEDEVSMFGPPDECEACEDRGACAVCDGTGESARAGVCRSCEGSGECCACGGLSGSGGAADGSWSADELDDLVEADESEVGEDGRRDDGSDEDGLHADDDSGEEPTYALTAYARGHVHELAGISA